MTNNQDRSAAILYAVSGTIAREQELRGSDRAALSRVRMLVASPRTVPADVHEHSTSAFGWLHRVGNLMLSWREIDVGCLKASIRRAAPLVGFGFEQIVPADDVEGLKPPEVTAQARTARATAGTSRGLSCVELLA